MFTKKNQLNRFSSLYKISFCWNCWITCFGLRLLLRGGKKEKSESWSSSWGVNGKLWLNVVFYFNDNQSGIFLLACHALWLIIKGIIKLSTTAINWLINPGSVWTIIIIQSFTTLFNQFYLFYCAPVRCLIPFVEPLLHLGCTCTTLPTTTIFIWMIIMK